MFKVGENVRLLHNIFSTPDRTTVKLCAGDIVTIVKVITKEEIMEKHIAFDHDIYMVKPYSEAEDTQKEWYALDNMIEPVGD